MRISFRIQCIKIIGSAVPEYVIAVIGTQPEIHIDSNHVAEVVLAHVVSAASLRSAQVDDAGDSVSSKAIFEN